MVFVTDRTEQDVLLGNKKGAYSFEDLNRVEGNVQSLAAILADLGFDDLKLVTKTDWAYPEDFDAASWPLEDQMKRYLGNVRIIQLKFSLPVAGSLPGSMDKLTWESANLIERILENAFAQAGNIPKAWKYSGELYAGEE